MSANHLYNEINLLSYNSRQLRNHPLHVYRFVRSLRGTLQRKQNL